MNLEKKPNKICDREPKLTNNYNYTVTNYLPNKRLLNTQKNQPTNRIGIHLRRRCFF